MENFPVAEIQASSGAEVFAVHQEDQKPSLAPVSPKEDSPTEFKSIEGGSGELGSFEDFDNFDTPFGQGDQAGAGNVPELDNFNSFPTDANFGDFEGDTWGGTSGETDSLSVFCFFFCFLFFIFCSSFVYNLSSFVFVNGCR